MDTEPLVHQSPLRPPGASPEDSIGTDVADAFAPSVPPLSIVSIANLANPEIKPDDYPAHSAPELDGPRQHHGGAQFERHAWEGAGEKPADSPAQYAPELDGPRQHHGSVQFERHAWEGVGEKPQGGCRVASPLPPSLFATPESDVPPAAAGLHPASQVSLAPNRQSSPAAVTSASCWACPAPDSQAASHDRYQAHSRPRSILEVVSQQRSMDTLPESEEDPSTPEPLPRNVSPYYRSEVPAFLDTAQSGTLQHISRK
ncbi:hypothetical protein DIPPA_35534 [Diplonema papillatum]|nr:hypothetical protein DIPPA_35534 [Diplonema papillatum]